MEALPLRLHLQVTVWPYSLWQRSWVAMLQARCRTHRLACKRKRHNPAGTVPSNKFVAKLSLLIAAVSSNPINKASAKPSVTAVLAGIVPDNRFPVRSIDSSRGASNQSEGMLPVKQPAQPCKLGSHFVLSVATHSIQGFTGPVVPEAAKAQIHARAENAVPAAVCMGSRVTSQQVIRKT